MTGEGLTNKRLLVIDKLTLYVVFSILFFFDGVSKFVTYSPLLILFLYYLFNILVGRKTGKYSSGSFFYFPALLVLGWVYGASRGTVLNNENVFVNNAGILIYLTYFFIERNSLNVGQLKKLLVNVFLASAIYYLLVLGPDTLLQVKISKLGVRQGGYTVSGIVTASILPLLFYNTIFSTRNRLLIKNKYKNYFLLMTFLFIILLLVASKGVYLSILFTLVILFFFTQGKTKT